MRLLAGAAVVAALVLGSLAPAGRASADPVLGEDSLEAELLAELNFARMHPQEYAQKLQRQHVSSWAAALRPVGGVSDPDAFDEAIEFLMRQSPLPPLSSNEELEAAALEHVAEQGTAGEFGHAGAGGERFDARLRRHGVTSAVMAENIAYGAEQASAVVRELIIDRGVASRGHRIIIFHPDLQAVGVKCGPHVVQDTMCVMDFAGADQQVREQRVAALTPPAAAGGGIFSRMLHWR